MSGGWRRRGGGGGGGGPVGAVVQACFVCLGVKPVFLCVSSRVSLFPSLSPLELVQFKKSRFFVSFRVRCLPPMERGERGEKARDREGVVRKREEKGSQEPRASLVCVRV